MCLSAVIFGILCLQWLREFTQEFQTMEAENAVAIRQERYEGLLAWRVPEIISALPVMLQASVILFFAGILELLWTLNRVVATIVTAAVGLATVALIFTTLAPFVQTIQYIYEGSLDHVTQCPYKSPLSSAIFRLVIFVTNKWLPGALDHVRNIAAWEISSTPWIIFDINWVLWKGGVRSIEGEAIFDVQGLAQALHWATGTFKLAPFLAGKHIVDIMCKTFESPSTCPKRRDALREVLREWANLAGDSEIYEVRLALQLYHDDPTDTPWLVLSHLLRIWLSGKLLGPTLSWRHLLELQLRCLNTLSTTNGELDNMFDSALWTHISRVNECKQLIEVYTY